MKRFQCHYQRWCAGLGSDHTNKCTCTICGQQVANVCGHVCVLIRSELHGIIISTRTRRTFISEWTLIDTVDIDHTNLEYNINLFANEYLSTISICDIFLLINRNVKLIMWLFPNVFVIIIFCWPKITISEIWERIDLSSVSRSASDPSVLEFLKIRKLSTVHADHRAYHYNNEPCICSQPIIWSSKRTSMKKRSHLNLSRSRIHSERILC